MLRLALLPLLLTAAQCETPFRIKLDVDAGDAVRVMHGGIGAPARGLLMW